MCDRGNNGIRLMILIMSPFAHTVQNMHESINTCFCLFVCLFFEHIYNSPLMG